MPDADAMTGDPMIDLMLDPDRPLCGPPLNLVVLSDEEVNFLFRLLTANHGFREDIVITTRRVLDAAGITEETAREALAKDEFYGDLDCTQRIDLALDPEHGFFDFVDDKTNPKWQNLG
jgi:hypothetical protein